MPKIGATWSIDTEVLELVKRETERRSAASGTKVSESATVNAVLREALSAPRADPVMAAARQIVTDAPARPKFGGSYPKPGSKP